MMTLTEKQEQLEVASPFDDLDKGWRKRGYKLGLGITSGYATMGVVGYEGRYDYTANGSSVNLASRLCDEAASGQILISHKAFIEIEQLIDVDKPRELEFKGFGHPVTAYGILGLGERENIAKGLSEVPSQRLASKQ